MRTLNNVTTALMALVVIAAGCGSDDPSTASSVPPAASTVDQSPSISTATTEASPDATGLAATVESVTTTATTVPPTSTVEATMAPTSDPVVTAPSSASVLDRMIACLGRVTLPDEPVRFGHLARSLDKASLIIPALVARDISDRFIVTVTIGGPGPAVVDSAVPSVMQGFEVRVGTIEEGGMRALIAATDGADDGCFPIIVESYFLNAEELTAYASALTIS